MTNAQVIVHAQIMVTTNWPSIEALAKQAQPCAATIAVPGVGVLTIDVNEARALLAYRDEIAQGLTTDERAALWDALDEGGADARGCDRIIKLGLVTDEDDDGEVHPRGDWTRVIAERADVLRQQSRSMTFQIFLYLGTAAFEDNFDQELAHVTTQISPKISRQLARSPAVLCTHAEDDDILRDTNGNRVGLIQRIQ